MFEALDPQTGSEAALVARAVIAHHAAAECFRPAVLPEVSLALQSRLIAQAAAVSRLSSQLVMALQLRALRDALIEAGASDARAQHHAAQRGDPSMEAFTPANPRPGRRASDFNASSTRKKDRVL